MSLSLDAIFRPLNDFFVQKFGAEVGAPVTFRFSHLPRAFVDSDFIAPLDPPAALPSPAIAHELLTAVVDGVPRLDPDGRTVWFSTSRLSNLYFDEIVGPAVPLVPADDSDPEGTQARIDAFNAAKAEALSLWENTKATSVIDGTGVWVRLSTAVPGRWWDKADPGTWTPQSFQVKGAATVPGQPSAPGEHLLRFKPDDNALRSILLAHVAPVATTPTPPPSVAVAHTTAVLSRPTLMMARPAMIAALATPAVSAAHLALPAGGVATSAVRAPAFNAAIAAHPAPTFALHDQLAPRFQALPFQQRFELQSILATNAPTQQVVTSDVTIGFDFCVVTVTRPWLHDAFIRNQSWRIPGDAKGQLSGNDGHGAPALPIGFVAIKNLRIVAPWTPEDISNLEQSVQFGPFSFDSKVINGAIGHEGIQIIGWMLQQMPDLPPNADVPQDPQDASQVPAPTPPTDAATTAPSAAPPGTAT